MEFSVEQYTNELVGFAKGGMPSRNKKNYRSTKRLFKYVDRVWEKLTDNWSYCNVCMKKDAAITILVILLVWLLV